MDSHQVDLPPPKNWQDLQEICHALWQVEWNCPTIQKNGRTGQIQRGVDIFGIPAGTSRYHGIQCKVKSIDAAKPPRLTETEVQDEVEQAKSFAPPLEHLILATTAPADEKIQAYARDISKQHDALGLFKVDVLAWPEIQSRLSKHEPLLERFYKSASAAWKALGHQVSEISDQAASIDTKLDVQQNSINNLEKHVANQNQTLDEIPHQLAQILENVTAIRKSQSLGIVVEANSSFDVVGLDTYFDRQIDGFRDLIVNGRCKSALDLLQRMWADAPKDVDPRIRFRILANIGAALLNLGEHEQAGKKCIEAYDQAPHLAKAIAQKVLGLTLLGRAREAYEFGTSSLDTIKDPAPVITNLIFAAKFLPELPDELDIIPPELSQSAEILVARIDLARTRANRDLWRKLAQQARELHPEHEIISRFSAEADIDAAFQEFEESSHQAISPSTFASVSKAALALQNLWEKYKAREDAWDDFHTSLGANLANSYLLLRQTRKAKDVVATGLKYAPDDQGLNRCQLIIATEENDKDMAATALAKLPESRDTIVARLQLAANSHDWRVILDIQNSANRSVLSPQDSAFLDAATLLAKFELKLLDDPRGEVRAILEKHPGDTAVHLLVHNIPRELGDEAWAKLVYESAIDDTESLSVASRAMLSQLAERERDFAKVIELLQGVVPLDEDSEELRRLARAHVNVGPRKDSLEFLSNLAPTLTSDPFYALVAADVHLNRGALPQAEIFFRTVIESDPHGLAAHLGLLSVFVRRGQNAEIPQHLRSLKVEKSRGSGTQKMQLAYFLTAFGRPQEGLKLAYETAIANMENERVAEMYVGIVLSAPQETTALAVPEKVTADCWVEIENEIGQKAFIIIDEGPNRPLIDHYNPSHELAKSVIDHRQNDSISIVGQSNHQWRIVSFKNKYAAFCHRIMNAAHLRALDTRNLQVIETTDDDVSPILDRIKDVAERDERIVQAYFTQSFPLALAAEILGKSSIEFSALVQRDGRSILTCGGAEDERQFAIRAVLRAREQGIVMDAYTAWTAYALRLAPALLALSKRIAVPRSSIDELLQWKRRFESHGDQAIMTVGYREGQYFREEIDASAVRRSIDAISEGISYIEANFEILPVDLPARLSQLEQRIVELGDAHVLDPIFASLHEGLLLVSEDMNLRKLAKQLHDLDGAWLQAVLMAAIDAGLMSLSAYAEALSDLGAAGHRHVSYSAPALVEMACIEQSDKLEKLERGLKSFALEGADLDSHLSVSANFMAQIWSARISDLRKERAVGLILERLAAMLAKNGTLEIAFSQMLQASVAIPDLHRYLKGWIRGHFLSA